MDTLGPLDHRACLRPRVSQAPGEKTALGERKEGEREWEVAVGKVSCFPYPQGLLGPEGSAEK